jgi:FemAB-related protein (PEP-CTERM system-associated)
MVDIRVITETTGSDWSRRVHAASGARLAHAAEWLSVVTRAYGHEPLYLVADSDAGCAVLPAFVVRRPLVGTVVTSMPFLDSGGPCAESPTLAALLVERLVVEARVRGARLVELRCGDRLAVDTEPMDGKVNMTLALGDGPDALWKRFDKGVRNQIRKAERSGLTVEFGGAAELPAFYDVFVERMRDLGSPVHALSFLREAVDRFGSSARVVVVKKDAAVIGGLVALTFKDRVVVPWATCLKEHFALCPNMLLYWETIRRASAAGAARFDFGRSTRGSGTYRFKQQWGAQDEPLFWYRIPVDAGRRRSAEAFPPPLAQRATTDPPKPSAKAGAFLPRSTDLLARAWQRLPLAVTRQVGPRIRKYLIQ